MIRCAWKAMIILSRIAPCGRTVQYKMILKPGLIPTQDDPENTRRRGSLRPDESVPAERRTSHAGADPRISQRQPSHRICGPEPSRAIRVCTAGAGGSGVRNRREQEAARDDSRLLEQGDRAELAATDAADSPVPAGRNGAGQAVPAASLSGQVPAPGCGVVGRGGSGSRLAQWASYGVYSQARGGAVRQSRVRAPGGDLGSASIQYAAQRRLPETGGGVETD